MPDEWQATIRGLFTIGRDTYYPGLGDTQGAGLAGVNVRAVPNARGRGVVFASPVHTAEELEFTVKVLGATEAATWTNHRALASAWRPAAGTEEIPLDVRWPGMAEQTMRVYGQPGPLSVSPATLKAGYLEAKAQFVHGGYWYGAERSGSHASALVIPAADAGHTGAHSDRMVLTITGNGGSPTLTHSSGGILAGAGNLAGGQTLVVDLHSWSAVKSSGGPALGNTSTWFRLVGGEAQTLTLTGAASVSATWRPAYWSP